MDEQQTQMPKYDILGAVPLAHVAPEAALRKLSDAIRKWNGIITKQTDQSIDFISAFQMRGNPLCCVSRGVVFVEETKATPEIEYHLSLSFQRGKFVFLLVAATLLAFISIFLLDWRLSVFYLLALPFIWAVHRLNVNWTASQFRRLVEKSICDAEVSTNLDS